MIKFRGILDTQLVCASALVSLTVFYFVPFKIYLPNISFETGSLATVFYLFTFTIISTSALILTGTVLPRLVRPYFIAFLLGLSVVAWLNSNLFSHSNMTNSLFSELTKNNEPFNFINVENILSVNLIVLAVVFGRYLGTRAGSVLIFLVGVQLLSSLYMVATGKGASLFYNNGATIINRSNLYKYSSDKPNVVCIVLDAMTSEVMLDLISENDEIKKVFSGFMLFTDTISMYNSTQLAIPSMLSGLYYDNKQTIKEYYYDAFFSNSSAIEAAKAAGFDTSFYSFMGFYIIGDRKDSVYEQIASAYLTGIVSTPVICSNLLELSPSQVLPSQFEKRYLDWLIDTGRIHSVLREINRNFVDALTAGASSKSMVPTFHFYHIAGAHRPYLSDVDGEVVNVDNSYENYRKHARNALSAVERTLSAFRTLGIYDNTSIIIVGDHGVPDTRKESNPAPHLMPLVMVKTADAHRAFVTSDLPVSLSDMRPLLGASFDQDGLTEAELISLLSKSDTRRVATFESSIFDRHFDDNRLNLREYLVSGRGNNSDSWKYIGEFSGGRFRPSDIVEPRIGEQYVSSQFGRGRDRGIALSGAWSIAEPLGVWTIGKNNRMSIQGDKIPNRSFVLNLKREVNADVQHPMQIEFLAGGRLLRRKLYTSADQEAFESFLISNELRSERGDIDLDININRSRPGRIMPGLLSSCDEFGVFLSAVSLTEPHKYRLGETAFFKSGGNGLLNLVGDWRQPELNGSWTGKSAIILLPLEKHPANELSMCLKATTLPAQGEVKVKVLVNDTEVITFSILPGQVFPKKIFIPSEVAQKSETLKIELRCEPEMGSDRAEGHFNQERCLFVESVTIQSGPTFPFDYPVFFGELSSGSDFQGGEWRAAETSGQWSGKSFLFHCPLVEAVTSNLLLKVTGTPRIPPGRHFRDISLSVNGKQFHVWRLMDNSSDLPPIVVPLSLVLNKRDIVFSFSCEGEETDNDDQYLFVRSVTLGPQPDYELGSRLSFSQGQNGANFLVDGFFQPEQLGTWSKGCSRIVLPLKSIPIHPLLIEMEGEGFESGTKIGVYVNNVCLATWYLVGDRLRPDPLLIPAAIAKLSDKLTVELKCESSNNSRCFFLQSLSVSRENPQPVPSALSFSKIDGGSRFLAGDLYPSEQFGTWVGNRAIVQFPVSGLAHGALYLSPDGFIASDRGDMIVSISANGRLVKSIHMTPDAPLPGALIPALVMNSADFLTIEFACATEINGNDGIQRSLFLKNIEISEASYELGERLKFAESSSEDSYQGGEWQVAEQLGTWSRDNATISFPLKDRTLPVLLEVDGEIATGAEGRTIELSVNGKSLVSWRLGVNHSALPPLLIPPSDDHYPDDVIVTFACNEAAPDFLPDRCFFFRSVRLVEAPFCSLGEQMTFAIGGNGLRSLHGAWLAPEALGIWSAGSSTIYIPLEKPYRDGLRVNIGGFGYVDNGMTQTILVKANGIKVATWVLTGQNPSPPSLELASDIVCRAKSLEIEIVCSQTEVSQARARRCFFLQSLVLENPLQP